MALPSRPAAPLGPLGDPRCAASESQEEMQQDAVDCAMHALDKYNIEKDIAAYVKKEFDKKCVPSPVPFVSDPVRCPYGYPTPRPFLREGRPQPLAGVPTRVLDGTASHI